MTDVAAAQEVAELAAALERAARDLRDAELPLDDAAEAVEQLAERAARLGAALEAEARAVPEAGPPGQESLL